MNGQDYTPEDALNILMAKLRANDSELAIEIQAAIDQGKDIQQTEPAKGRKKAREYRKTVPFSRQEALQVAINALNAYFVEQPLFRNSCQDNIAQAVVGKPRRQRYTWEREISFAADMESQGKEKAIEIELVTETQLPSDTTAVQLHQETWKIERVTTEGIQEQQRNLARVRELMRFEDQ